MKKVVIYSAVVTAATVFTIGHWANNPRCWGDAVRANQYCVWALLPPAVGLPFYWSIHLQRGDER